MWATEWATLPESGPSLAGSPSKLDARTVELAYALLWMEHCIECAIPECYAVCPLYVKRRDRKCARLRYGIYPNPAFRGLFGFGADVHFRRWGKLESALAYGAAEPARIQRLAEQDRAILSLVNVFAAALEPVNPKRRLNGLYQALRDRRLAWATRDGLWRGPRFDDFVVEVFNPNPAPVSLIIEVHQDRLRFRDSVLLEPGPNFHRIPVAKMDVNLGRFEGRILVYPDNDAEVRLIFTWLDYVRYTPAAREAAGAPVADGPPAPVRAKLPKPAAKVKCVAWDLDNTLWRGIMVEDGPEALTLRPGVVEVIKQLDERGILNTIVSKNDMAQAWGKITELGLNEYFVSPAINWGMKSANVKAVAEALNINADTFALIDDSSFERSEVQSELPQVRVFPETQVPTLLARPEFDVPITEETRQRRFSYLAEDKRRQIAATFGDNYDAFLKSCEMRTVLFHPLAPKHQQRVLELIQRSNQLNLSTRRYTKEEFEVLLEDPGTLALAWTCRDRHGDYGTVGFLSLSMAGEIPVLQDLVVSCRVAKKKVENALFQWLALALRERGVDHLHAWYVPTARNHVLLDALIEVGFEPHTGQDGYQVLALPVHRDVPGGAIVHIEANAVRFPIRAGAA